MLYKKKNQEKLDMNLFKNPTSEYRGTPFWAWNCKLDKEELLRQIEVFKEMGFGGYHMHVRTGMATKYLSEEFMDLIKSCIQKGKEKEMLSYLYDEDRWPSGSAGGMVTKNEEYRQRFLLFTTIPYAKHQQESEINSYHTEDFCKRAENGELLACYDIVLNDKGELESYNLIDKDAAAKGTKWYAYLEKANKSSWFNGEAYVDTLNKSAMDEFINITYNAYNDSIGEEFGNTVPSIFTDEPQAAKKVGLKDAFDKTDCVLTWTKDFPETFKEAYNEDVMASLPEIIWELPNGKASTVRYHYHDHVAERFVSAFADNCGKWCDEHNLMLTGHVLGEPTLENQIEVLGEAMRCYRSFHIPGIDVLCDSREFTAAKQVSSIVHQYDKEGAISELYGVTGWNYDFRGHKLQGDWQHALGITLRVPHLSWVAMKGEAKRDYPASISYQSPWYTEYKNVEDHFSRLSVVLTRGKPKVNIGVIHPIESFWVNYGPRNQKGDELAFRHENFWNFSKWMVKGLVDYDYICESLLPDLCEKGSAPLKVGKMEYDVIIVPDCYTLRKTTLDRLYEFKNQGGTLIFVGNPPKLEDAKESSRGLELYNQSVQVENNCEAILNELDKYRNIRITDKDGNFIHKYCHQLREDGDSKWLFIAQGLEPEEIDREGYEDIVLSINGEYIPTVYNTLTGNTEDINCEYEDGNTVIKTTLYNCDCLLLELKEGKKINSEAKAEKKLGNEIQISNKVEYTLSEPNVMLLDKAEFKLDDGEYQEKEELLRADNKLRDMLGIPHRGGQIKQPWAQEKEIITHTATLRFNILSDIDIKSPYLALEDADVAEIYLNGEKVENNVEGYYVDISIGKIPLKEIKKGENILEITLPFGVTTNIEWCYLLGDFAVEVNGENVVLKEKPEKIMFGDITEQGFGFYGGNITYHIPLNSQSEEIRVNIPKYVGGLVTIENKNGKTPVIYPPYNADIKVEKGESTLDLTLYGNRHNSFGYIHHELPHPWWKGPNCWRSEGEEWTDEYRLLPLGIIESPKLFEIE